MQQWRGSHRGIHIQKDLTQNIILRDFNIMNLEDESLSEGFN